VVVKVAILLEETESLLIKIENQTLVRESKIFKLKKNVTA
jgi:hypothetical protein